MSKYYIWTIGCQMNVADSQRLGSALEQLGYDRVAGAEDADIVILNSCVVRQGAEDKVVADGRQSHLFAPLGDAVEVDPHRLPVISHSQVRPVRRRSHA